MIGYVIKGFLPMRNKRKRHESGHGTTSQAFRCTKYSLLCYRAPSQKSDGSPIEWELLSEWEDRLHLSRENIRYMLKQRWLYLKICNHLYHIRIKDECAAAIENYILFSRKNHPAKKGQGKHGVTSYSDLDGMNRILYPGGVDLIG